MLAGTHFEGRAALWRLRHLGGRLVDSEDVDHDARRACQGEVPHGLWITGNVQPQDIAVQAGRREAVRLGRDGRAQKRRDEEDENFHDALPQGTLAPACRGCVR